MMPALNTIVKFKFKFGGKVTNQRHRAHKVVKQLAIGGWTGGPTKRRYQMVQRNWPPAEQENKENHTDHSNEEANHDKALDAGTVVADQAAVRDR